MAVKTREEILSAVNTILGDNDSDDAISLIEDISDTISDYENRTSSDVDWQKRYEDNDKEWRQKYKDRFFNHSSEDDSGTDEEILEPERTVTKTKFEELFSQKGE